MFDKKALLKNGSEHVLAEVVEITRNLRQYVFDGQQVNVSAFTQAAQNQPYEGQNARLLKQVGLLTEDGTLNPTVLDVLESIKTPRGGYMLNAAAALAPKSKAGYQR